MKSILLAGMAAAALGCAMLTSPASAAPVPTSSVAQPASGIAQTQMRRERRMIRNRMARQRMMNRRMMRNQGRRASPSQAGNARNPSRPVYQQNQGQTTGGGRM